MTPTNEGIEIRIKSWKENANISEDLAEKINALKITMDTGGAYVTDKKTERTIGPFPDLGSLNSREIGEFFGIPPRHIIALVLALSSGVEKFRFDQAMRVIEEYRRVKGLGHLMKVQLNAK